MKLSLRSLFPVGVALAAIAAVPFAANAQTAPTDYNYVGAGVAVGDLGDSDVGLGINSKFTLGEQFSARPAIHSDLDFDDDGVTRFMLPVTYDFNALDRDGKLLPYVGGGVAFSTGNDEFGGLVTAGADYRITERVVANGSVNLTINDDTDVNGFVGLGYSF
ncbi:MAG: hypothetical protein HC886_02485 [Leptolyngbyaceae cyanobacterium SM1_1_3]|nr:hypothetical protein [Leptolyngbyaceae cyanobacterium SM1_1_3]NJN03663.1 hypothetical protein [Leptolyngbyaceae cyanobacterium RM1_1_2]NJO09127.1 hypothetical protein [Leptolyngbyaceae cyanobacterium SL_1_1]